MDSLLTLINDYNGWINYSSEPVWLWLTGLVLFWAYIGGPFIALGVVILAVALGVSAPTEVLQALLVVVAIGSIPFIRRQVVTRFIMKTCQVLSIFPKVSDTERIALEAGDVWLDGVLFQGNPTRQHLKEIKYPKLTATERAFLEGPVETLCGMVNDWEVHQKRELPSKVWDYIKKEGFLGIIIPKKYGDWACLPWPIVKSLPV